MKRRGILLVLFVLGAFAVSRAEGTERFDGSILGKVEGAVLQEMGATGQGDFFIWLTEKADLSPASRLKTKKEKGRFVFETLRRTAERSQREVRAYLDSQGIPYRPFYIANKILVRGGNLPLLSGLASFPNVAKVTANRTYQLPRPIINPAPPPHLLGVESNIAFVGAPDVWAFGYTGQGVVLAGNDTGLDETHPALASKYRGCLDPPACTSWSHDYNWWDATGTYPTDPYDGHGHGTFTTGIMLGDDGAGNQIGVAPGARTIHCKNMGDSGWGSDATFSECLEWDLAPWDLTGGNPDPAKAPDVVNNSWGYWGGAAPQFEDEIEALQAAGIVVVAAAGNEGSGCGSLRSPGDYEQVLTVGSVDHSGSPPGTINSFSSRGPSALYPFSFFPDVMAPGQNIRSSIPGGTYEGGWSGTSMAAPHITGIVALMWSFAPGLRGHVEETMEFLRWSSFPLTGQTGSNCGGDYSYGPNNDWGYGSADAMYAVLWPSFTNGYMSSSPESFQVTLKPNQVTAEELSLDYWNPFSSLQGMFTITEIEGGTFPPPVPAPGGTLLTEGSKNGGHGRPQAEVGPLSVRGGEGRVSIPQAFPGPLAGPWISAAPLPPGDGVVRYGHAQCQDEANRFYVISGVDESFSPTDKVWRYDAEGDTWTELSPIPNGVEGPSAVCYGGFIYVAGGSGTDQFYIYDIQNDQWIEGPPVPRNVWGAAIGAWNGRIYLAGGDSDFWIGGTSNEVNIYDIAANRWVGYGEAMPEAAVASGYAQAGRYLYVVGGWNDSSPTANVRATQRFDMLLGSWETGPLFLSARSDFALAVTSERLYAVRGDTDGGGFFEASDKVEVLQHTSWPKTAWTEIDESLPVAITSMGGGFCTESVAGGEVWSVGGIRIDPWTVVGTNQYNVAEPCFKADVSWLSADPVKGAIAPGAAELIKLTFDSKDLPSGTYEAQLRIDNSTYIGPILIPIKLTVVPLAITATAGPHGTISPSGIIEPAYGSDVGFTVTPDPGYHIEDLLVDGVSVGPSGSYTFYNVTSDHTIRATFAIDTYTITASSSGNGTISPSGSVGTTYGSVETFSLTPATGYHVGSVTGTCGGTLSGNTFTTSAVTGDCTVVANFAINTYTVTPSVPGGNGTLAPSTPQTVSYGGTTAFTVTAATGYHVVGVTGCGGSLVGSTYTTGSISENCTVVATFATDTYTITASSGSNGNISPSGGVTVNHGSDQTFVMSPAPHYHVADVVVDGVSVGAVGSYTFEGVTADHTISVTFAIDTYTIHAVSGDHGMLTPSGDVSVSHGGNQVFNITPDTGYYVLDVVVDGRSVGAVSSYTFTSVTEEHWIYGTFAPAKIAVLPASINFGNVPSWSTSEETVTVLNVGLVNLLLGSIGTPSGPFSRMAGGCASGMTLSPGDVCTMDVNFAPTTSGVFESSFTVASNALEDPTVTVALLGGSGADLTGEWSVPVTQICKSKCKLTGSLRVKNIGNLPAVSSAVRFYLSDDGVHFTEGGFLKQVSTGAIKAGLGKVKKLSVTLPTGSSAKDKYVIAVIDSSNVVTEANEANNNIASIPIP